MIPDVTVRVRPAPTVRHFEAWIAESFEAGAEIVRAMAQGPGLPDVIRVSDEEETRVSLALSGPRGLAGRLFDGYLGLRGRRGGCLIVVGIDGDEESVARRRALAVRAPARRRRRLPRPVRRAQLGQGPLRRPLPARHADGDGGDRRDARDLPHLDAARRAPPRGRPMRSAARSAPRARPGSRSATSRTPTPTAPRSTSPTSPAPATGPSSTSGARSSAPPRRRSSPPARRSPTITRSAATTSPTWRPRSGAPGSRRCAR